MNIKMFKNIFLFKTYRGGFERTPYRTMACYWQNTNRIDLDAYFIDTGYPLRAIAVVDGTIYNAAFGGSLQYTSGIYWENNIRYDLDISGLFSIRTIFMNK